MTYEARWDATIVQESCTLLDTQSQQIMYKRRQSQLPTIFSQEKHTFLTEYHGIHTDKLVSPVSVGFKFIYHYIIDLFSVLFCSYITLLYKWENHSVERGHRHRWRLWLGCVQAFWILLNIQHSWPRLSSSSSPLSHNLLTVRLNMPVSQIPK